MAVLPAVTIGPETADYSVIWLHGLGADGHDFEPIVDELNFPNKNSTRFIFPHAPQRPVTLNNGYVMPAWYDVVAIDGRSPEDVQGIRESQQQLIALIKQEFSRGIDSRHIVLAGFSQGGAVALQTALRFEQPLAGLLALSTYLPLADSLQNEASNENKNIAIFMVHGDYDPIVPLPLATDSKQRLINLGYSVEWKTYPMEHSVCPQEIVDIDQWFSKVLS
ncbi:MAG: alpha/beta fold hydrolase [Thioalkalispiraceae bacterium]|jgi:phospholipase/carboxylesterase